MKNYISIFLFLVSGSVYAQNEIITDRPDQTESPNAVGVGIVQIESGLLFQRTEISKTVSQERFVYPTSLFRIGLAKKLELRVVSELVTYKVADNEKQEELTKITGMENLQLGFKYQFSENTAKTIVGVMAHAIVPTGSRGIGNQNYGIFSRINISHDLSEKRNISGNFGYNNYRFRFDEEGLKREVDGDFTYTLVYGHGISERVGLYIEAFGDYVNFEDWIHNMDAGITYLVSDNIQLDYSLGWGLNQVMNYQSIGISLRLPK